ncbi:MAG: SHOCT domain-containing protein [Chlorobi bacterium]|nr:SHOCT domain-containing protein [Chlorobiota bacterium]
MELLSRKQINEIFGKFGYMNDPPENTLQNAARYIAGIREINEYFHRKGYPLHKAITYIKRRPKGLEIKVTYAFKTFRVGLFNYKIKYWTLINTKDSDSEILQWLKDIIQENVPDEKDKGFDISQADHILILGYDDYGKEERLFFSITDKKRTEVKTYMMKHFNLTYKNPESLYEKHKEQEYQGEPLSISITFSIADELRKLKELTDEGVLTPEEFERLKRKLLNQ